jgi:hypothetical protein
MVKKAIAELRRRLAAQTSYLLLNKELLAQ